MGYATSRWTRATAVCGVLSFACADDSSSTGGDDGTSTGSPASSSGEDTTPADVSTAADSGEPQTGTTMGIADSSSTAADSGASESGSTDAASSSGTGEGTTTGDASSSTTEPGTTEPGTTGSPILDCDDFVGQATPAEVALSPYPLVEPEVLGYEATGEVVTPADVYDRIELDLDAIRTANPEVAGIFAMPSWNPGSLLVGFDDDGAEAVAAGTYVAWDCPNELYELVAIDTGLLDFIGVAVLEFDGRYNALTQALDYADLPNVDYVEPDSSIGDGNDVCVAIDGETYTYIFDAGSGDCLAGCILHSYWGFSTNASGDITTLGETSNQTPVQPDWFLDAGDCTAWL